MIRFGKKRHRTPGDESNSSGNESSGDDDNEQRTQANTPRKNRLFSLLDHHTRLRLSKNDCYALEAVPSRTARR